jgi:DNA-binding MarR family transcriptional regulator
MNADPDEVADSFLLIRRRFEAEAGKAVPARDRATLRDLNLEQLSLLGRMPLDGIDENLAPSRLALAEGRFKAVLEELVTAGLIDRRPAGPASPARLVLTELGRRARATLDRMQRATLKAMVETIGPDRARQLVEVLESAFPQDA